MASFPRKKSILPKIILLFLTSFDVMADIFSLNAGGMIYLDFGVFGSITWAVKKLPMTICITFQFIMEMMRANTSSVPLEQCPWMSREKEFQVGSPFQTRWWKDSWRIKALNTESLWKEAGTRIDLQNYFSCMEYEPF